MAIKFKNVTTSFNYLLEQDRVGGSNVNANPTLTGEEQVLNSIKINNINYVVGGMQIFTPVAEPVVSGFRYAGEPVTTYGYDVLNNHDVEGFYESMKEHLLAKGGETQNNESYGEAVMLSYTEDKYTYQIGIMSGPSEMISNYYESSYANLPANAFLATDGASWIYQEMAVSASGEQSGETPVHTHSWGEWVVTVQPTDKSNGERQRECTVCGEKQTEEIPMIIVEDPEPTVNFQYKGTPVTAIGESIVNNGYSENLITSIKNDLISAGAMEQLKGGVHSFYYNYAENKENQTYGYDILVEESSAEYINSSYNNLSAEYIDKDTDADVFIATDGESWVYYEAKSLVID